MSFATAQAEEKLLSQFQARLCDLLGQPQDTVKYCMRNLLYVSLPFEGVVAAGLCLIDGLGA